MFFLGWNRKVRYELNGHECGIEVILWEPGGLLVRGKIRVTNQVFDFPREKG
jgi:hypothetical protein